MKRHIRRKRKELVDLEEELVEVTKQYKTVKQIQMKRKHKASLLERARNGGMRISKIEFLKMVQGEECEC